MTADEFMRKLKDGILKEGYNSSDLQVLSIADITPSDNGPFDTVFSVRLYSCEDREFLKLLIETD